MPSRDVPDVNVRVDGQCGARLRALPFGCEAIHQWERKYRERVEQVDVQVRTMGGRAGHRVDRFEGHRLVVVKRCGGRKEAFWMALHLHEEDENGFEMHGGDDGKVRFRYEGRERYFEVGEDHSAVETDVVVFGGREGVCDEGKAVAYVDVSGLVVGVSWLGGCQSVGGYVDVYRGG